MSGYRLFCTPHCGAIEFTDLSVPEIAERVRSLRGHIATANIPIDIKPGGELRLSPLLAEELPEGTVPTFARAGKYVLADLWEPDWPIWATRAVKLLQNRGHIVILAHPERMPVLHKNPDRINELADLGLLFQGNLGPIGGADSPDITALSHRYLKENRYFVVGFDCHRQNHMKSRLKGLQTIEDLLGKE